MLGGGVMISKLTPRLGEIIGLNVVLIGAATSSRTMPSKAEVIGVKVLPRLLLTVMVFAAVCALLV